MYVLFWGVAVMITVAYVYKHGEEFVNQPRLLKVDWLVTIREKIYIVFELVMVVNAAF